MWEYCGSGEERRLNMRTLIYVEAGRQGGSRDHGAGLSWQPPVRSNHLSQYNLNISAGRLTGNNWLQTWRLTRYFSWNIPELLVLLSSLMTTWYHLSLLSSICQSAGSHFIKTSLPSPVPTCPHSSEWLFSLECSAVNVGGGRFYW